MTKNQRKWGLYFDVAASRDKISELEEVAADPEFWNDMEKSKKVLQQTAALKAKVQGYDDLVSKYEEINTIIEMGREEDDEELARKMAELGI